MAAMGRPRGKRPAPTVLKIIQGVTRVERVNRDEPYPGIAVPDPPVFLDGDAMVEWERVVQEAYRCGLISNFDRYVLASYCQSVAKCIQAENALKGQPLTIETDRGTVANPLINIARNAMADMVRYAIELGMTPSSRSRVHAVGTPIEDDKAAKYLATG